MPALSLSINTGSDINPVYTAIGNLLTAVIENSNYNVTPKVQGDLAFSYTAMGSADPAQVAMSALGSNVGSFSFTRPNKPTLHFSGVISNLRTVAGVTSGKINIGSNVKFSLGSNPTVTVIHH
jgi:hypothetical protein